MYRLVDITYIVLKYDLESFLTSYKLHKIFNFGSKFKRLFFKKIDAPIEKRLRCALEELGPVFIKLGQILSTRQDLLPSRFTKELSKLNDSVSSQHIDLSSILRENLNQFSDINYTPIAAGSIAQVYEATLHNDEPVVIKILRPNTEISIKRDLEFFKQLIKTYSTISSYKSNVVKGILAELEISLLQEIDFEKEVENAERFRENMKDFSKVIVPKIYKEFCSKNVIVMQRMYGTPIDKVDKLKEKEFSLSQISEEGLELLMIQILKNRFFHADLHPGNLWIDDFGNRVYLDFGIMGTLSKFDRDMLADMIVSLYVKNYERFVELQIQSGWVDTEINTGQYIEEIKKVFDFKLFSKSLNDIFKVGEKYGINVPVQFTLLAKTLLVTESNASKLNANLDVGNVGASIFMKHFKAHLRNNLKDNNVYKTI